MLSWNVSFCMYIILLASQMMFYLVVCTLHLSVRGGGGDDLKFWFRTPWHCAMVGGWDEALALDYLELTKWFLLHTFTLLRCKEIVIYVEMIFCYIQFVFMYACRLSYLVDLKCLVLFIYFCSSLFCCRVNLLDYSVIKDGIKSRLCFKKWLLVVEEFLWQRKQNGFG